MKTKADAKTDVWKTRMVQSGFNAANDFTSIGVERGIDEQRD
jgi:hypothetical protein